VSEHVAIDGSSLTLPAVAAVGRERATVALDAGARERMSASQAWVARAAEGRLKSANGEPLPVYGVNTGYGSLARVRIPPADIPRLSMNLVKSHAAGVGPPIASEAVRAMMLLRANALAKGASGCRPVLVETLAQMLNRGVVPEVPSRGSCGSSGDLAPLSHLALVVFDGPDQESGTAWIDGARLTGRAAMARAGIARLVPAPKEGLAMTNGAQLTTALTALAVHDAARLAMTAEIACALSWEALRGVTRALHPAVQALRPFRGAQECASNLRRLLLDSSLVDTVPGKVQDAYALRCAPPVQGAVRDAIRYATAQVGVELNAVTDNPVILLHVDGENKAFSAGLFHGEPIGFAADHLKLALCELGSIAERRIYRLTTGHLSSLPPALSGPRRPDLGSMSAQITAAALVAESRQLAWPASADSIPTCEDQEDHVAMSTTAARRATEVLANAERVVAIELLVAARGCRLRLEEGSGAPGPAARAAIDAIEAATSGAEVVGEAIEHIARAVKAGHILSAVEAVCGPLEGVGV
jgi:histidine ammonia-lyase